MRLASKRIVTRLRWWLRALRRYLTGRSAMVPQLVKREALMTVFRDRILAYTAAQVERRKDNRDLLTGMIVALLAGPNLSPWSGWEYYRAHAGRKRNGAKGRATRLVGRPVVYKDEHGTKIGMTEFRTDYVPRKEQLAARKAARKEAQQLRRAA